MLQVVLPPDAKSKLEPADARILLRVSQCMS